MSTSIHGWGVSVRFPGGVQPFPTVDFSFGPVRTGLVGRNGAGKSTLLRVLAGRLAPASGQVATTGRVILLDQAGLPAAHETVADVLKVGPEIAALTRAQTGAASAADLDLLEDNWDLAARIESALAAVGLSGFDPGNPCACLSGGELSRARLARLFLDAPDFVLLDEPTNHLDRKTRGFVYEWVAQWKRGLVVVSHDEVLLDLMDETALLDERGLHWYGGNYTFFRAQREMERAAAEDRLAHASGALKAVREQAQEARERQEQRQASGRRQARRTGVSLMAAGIMKRRAEGTAGRLVGRHDGKLERAATELARAKDAVVEARPINIDLASTAVPSRKRLLELRGVNVRYGSAGLEVWRKPVDLAVYGPERIALTGSNGSGKSTLLGLISGAFTPSAGAMLLPERSPAVLDQNVRVLDPARTLVENVRHAAPARSESDLRLLLARFLFEAEAAEKPVSVLSGGERMRAGLVCLLCRDQAPELLLLDEPTNNLDLEAVDEMVSVLRQFRGALIVASHDDAFLARLKITRTIDLDEWHG